MGETWFFAGDGLSQAASLANYTAYHLPRRIDRIRIMRIPFCGWGNAVMEGEPGHYWIEIDHDDKNTKESYGWYPDVDITSAGAVRKVQAGVSMFSPSFESGGCINGDSPQRRTSQEAQNGKVIIAGGGIGTLPFPWDPHHGARDVRSVRHPYVLDDRSENEILSAIRSVAANYKEKSNGRWSFKFDDPAENNCHTFVWELLCECGLIDPDILDDNVDPHFSSIAIGGRHVAPVTQVIGYLNRPKFVEYHTVKAKQVLTLLRKHGR